jgi:hypothetical protein
VSEHAVPAAAVLDGETLSAAPASEWRIARQELRSVRQSANGARREYLLYADPALPMILTKQRFAIAWARVGALRPLVEELIAVPGEHTLSLWRRETLAYAANGVRNEWTLPNGWTVVTDTLSPPDGRPVSEFEPRVKVGRGGAQLNYVSQPPVDFDAGAPGAGEVWFAGGESRFKLDVPPAAGEVVYVSIVPLYRVFRDPQVAEKRLTHPLAEPAELTLVES